MNEPLVDFEGYPRADVDVYQVRTARHNIICEWPLWGSLVGMLKALKWNRLYSGYLLTCHLMRLSHCPHQGTE